MPAPGRTCVALIALLAALPSSAVPAQNPAPSTPHDRAFWLRVVENDYLVPAGGDPFALLVEMNALLGSTDPVLRDQVAYGAAARWVYRERRLSPAELKRLLALWSDNLTRPAGGDADPVLQRSFSALNLSLLAALDLASPFMTQDEFDRLLGAALAYLRREHDTRGYETGTGWVHATAHTADLLKFLARSPRLPPAKQAALLGAISEKCVGAGDVFVWGEDERLAQVVQSIARRDDADLSALDAWLAAIPPQHRELWARSPAIDPRRYAGVRNLTLVLRAAYTALSAGASLPLAASAARQSLLDTLAKMQ